MAVRTPSYTRNGEFVVFQSEDILACLDIPQSCRIIMGGRGKMVPIRAPGDIIDWSRVAR